MKIVANCLLLVLLVAGSAAADIAEVAKSSGVQGGVVVHLGCGNGRQTATLRLDDRYLVHGLDTDEANIREAREYLLKQGVYGKVSVAKYDGKRLPYTDNFVNLIIDSTGDEQVSQDEMIRVLVPGGVAVKINPDTRNLSPIRRGGTPETFRKPWPDDIDLWTHFLHGPDNNAVARDRRVDVPRSIQWVSEPRWGRSHEELASMSSAVSASGRLFYIVDEAPLISIRFRGNWKVVARDAFNGTLLWKRDLPLWNDHLRHFRSGPAHLPRRLVAVGDTVYVTMGLAGPVTALDAATGEPRQVYDGTERTEEILVDDGVLYLAVGTSEVKRRGGGLHERDEPAPTDFRFVTAIDADSGKTLWKSEFPADEYLLPLTLAVKGPRVYYQSTKGVACLDARTGKRQWLTPRETPAVRMGFTAPTLVATDEVILCADRDAGGAGGVAKGTVEWGVHGWSESGFPRGASSTLRAYAANDGTELWSAPCKELYNSPVDVFVIDGLVRCSTGYAGLDLKTGEVRHSVNTKGAPVGMAHHRCYRNKASERFVFMGRSGIEVVSLEDGWLCNNSWIRGTCQYGILPANGLLYAPPDACGCFLTVKVPGLFAAAPQHGETGHMPFPDKPVLEKSPAFGEVGSRNSELGTIDAGQTPNTVPHSALRIPHSEDWPMYRRDAARSGTTSVRVPDTPAQRWSATIGGKLTQPVIAGDKVFVAAVDAHTVHALSVEDGKPIWHFTAGGRIDSSPTIYRGTVLFGSADGWVYCLRADDGQLAWRFRAAPEDRLVGVYGQLESAWAVHGAVLVQNDSLYFTAGRTSYTDGGIVLYRLDPATGEQLSRTMLYHLDPDTGKQLTSEAKFNMEGTGSDILSGDGDSVFLKYFCFDAEGHRTNTKTPHLWSITGFLGEDWYVRSYWIFGEQSWAGWGGWATAANTYPSGRILSFDDDKVYGYGRAQVAGGATGHRADTYHLFSMNKMSDAPPAVSIDKRGRKKVSRKKPALIWGQPQELIVRALALAGEHLVVAGPVDVAEKETDVLAYKNEAEALAALAGRKDSYLHVVSATNGEELSAGKLAAPPVFDGLAVAKSKIFISLKNGDVVCFGKPQ